LLATQSILTLFVSSHILRGVVCPTSSFYHDRLLKLAVPLALENSLWYASNIISTIFIGHLGKHELASVVLGESVFNVTG